jgi:hypothetical protein
VSRIAASGSNIDIAAFNDTALDAASPPMGSGFVTR